MNIHDRNTILYAFILGFLGYQLIFSANVLDQRIAFVVIVVVIGVRVFGPFK